MIRTALGVAACAALFATYYFFLDSPPAASPPTMVTEETVMLDDTPVRVAVVDTDASRTRGLSGYAPLKWGEGMLFVFEEEGAYSFWMKDMLFSIDILWFDAAGKLVHIEREVSPASYPASFTPGSPAQYVLEVPAGFAAEHEIVVGSKLTNFPSEK